MRCHAGQCTDPDSLSPEDAVDDGGMPAHPQCATYADELELPHSFTCTECGTSGDCITCEALDDTQIAHACWTCQGVDE